MKRRYVTFAAALAVAAALHAAPGHGQSRDLQQRLANATRIDCSFSMRATGTWNGDTPDASVAPGEFEASFFDINVDEGTAEADSRFGSSFIVVRRTEDYLHLMQMLNAGPLYLTTVLARQTDDGRFLAVHTRHEYLQVSLPGFTSRPEMYVGSCEVSG